MDCDSLLCCYNWLSFVSLVFVLPDCDLSYCSLKPFLTLNYSNTMGGTSQTGTAYHSGAPEFTPGSWWGSCYSIVSFMCMFCRSLFVLLYFFFWSLCCLLFFDLRILITSLWYLQTLFTWNPQYLTVFYIIQCNLL